MPAVTPTTIPTLTPTETLVPTPTIKPTAVPAQEINLDDVFRLLFSQSSFHFVNVQNYVEDGNTIYFEGIWVNDPPSLHLWQLDEGGEHLIEAIQIDTRIWGTLGESLPRIWFPESLDEALEYMKCTKPDISEEECKEGIIAMHSLHIYLSKSLLQDDSICTIDYRDPTTAFFTGDFENINGINAAKYSWSQQEDDTYWYIYIDADSGLPIKYEQIDNNEIISSCNFSNYNNPENVIDAPTTNFPEKIHIDDVRMALNNLVSFQYKVTTVIDKADPITLYFKGIFDQNLMTWQSFYYEDETMADDQPYGYICNVQHCWDDLGKFWSLYNGDSQDLQVFNPFYIWSTTNNATEGELVSENSITINDYSCDTYLFEWEENGYKRNLKLYTMSGSMLPLKAELTLNTANGIFYLTWEISHLNDENNVIEIPED